VRALPGVLHRGTRRRQRAGVLLHHGASANLGDDALLLLDVQRTLELDRQLVAHVGDPRRLRTAAGRARRNGVRLKRDSSAS
jgi:hypothetical protein